MAPRSAERFCHRCKTAAMDRAGAEPGKGFGVRARAIALVRGKSVAGKFAVSTHHQIIPRRLGEDRGGGNLLVQPIAADHGLCRAGQSRGQVIAVDPQQAGQNPKRLNCAAHCQMRGLANVQRVDFLSCRPAQRGGLRPAADLFCQLFTSARRQCLGIRKPENIVILAENHRAGTYRACPWPTTGLVYAADQVYTPHDGYIQDSHGRRDMAQSRYIEMSQTGGVEVLQLKRREVPAPGPGEVCVRQSAIGVNFIDTYHRTGLYPVRLPFIPGSEGAGLVESVGEGVTGLQPGDRVAYLGGAAYGEHFCGPAARMLPLPDDVSEETAAAVLLKGLTAWMLLFEVRRAQAGESALVWAPVGGVGSLLVPWATSLGMRVIAVTSSAEKAARARSLGASEVILSGGDVAAQARELTGGRGVDVAYDSVGRTSAEASLSALKPRGWWISYGNASGPAEPVAPTRLGQLGSLVLTRPGLFHFIAAPADLARGASALFGALRTGTIKAHIGQRFSLEDAGEAHSALESGQTIGASLLIP